MFNNIRHLLFSAVIAAVTVNCAQATDHHESSQYCTATAEALSRACRHDVKDDYWVSKAVCINISDDMERLECLNDAREERSDAWEECGEQLDARLELCAATGENRYEPDFSPANFVDPADIGGVVLPNPYFPLVTDNQWIYEGDGEKITVTVTGDTKLIEGVTCVVVRDTAEEDGVIVEDTDDWYAQDLDGNVWYCGELSREFELFEGDNPEQPELVALEGSFKTGREGAKPGILVKAIPEIGDILRQEFALGEAEDIAEVINVTAMETSPAASCAGNCLQTKEYTPIEPDVFEHKYYVPGVGLILEKDREGNREVELVEYTLH